MRDPFGFISYRVGPPPHVIVSAVAWSLVIIVVLTLGVRTGLAGWGTLRDILPSREGTAASATGQYDSTPRTSATVGTNTLEATPWSPNSAPADSESPAAGLVPLPKPAGDPEG